MHFTKKVYISSVHVCLCVCVCSFLATCGYCNFRFDAAAIGCCLLLLPPAIIYRAARSAMWLQFSVKEKIHHKYYILFHFRLSHTVRFVEIRLCRAEALGGDVGSA